VRFAWLQRGNQPRERDDDGSCVLRVSAGGYRFPLTGDSEAAAAVEPLRVAAPQAADVAVAPHHGGRTSPSAAFLPAMRPRRVVFTVGHRNRCGAPAAARMARRGAHAAHTWRASASGAIEFVARPGKPLAQAGQRRSDPRRFRVDP